jgi:membrane associated rhomboid family serine protease
VTDASAALAITAEVDERWPGLATVGGVSWLQAPAPERRRSTAGTALRAIVLFVGLLYAVEVLDQLSGSRLQSAGGVEPRETSGLDGVLFAPMLHGPWEHLLANTVPLLVFGFLLLLAGVRRWLLVTAVVWVVGGAGVWLTGAAGTVHLGASVLVFGWLTYLLLRGLFSGHPGQLALGVVLLLVYGGVLWGVLPGQPGISWQGHLFGAIGGGLAAWWLGRVDRATGRRHGWP